MSFLGNLVSEFTGHHKNQEQPPQAPPPWVARWDDSASRWIFVNEQTGERTHNYPQQGNGGGYNGGYAPQGGYGQQSGYPPQSGYPQQSGYPPQGGYGQPAGYGYPQGGGYGGQQGGYPQEEPKKKSNALGYGVAAVAGIAGGALLVHEGEKVHEHYEEDKYRLENKVADGVQDVEDFPEDAAQWTGRKVGEIENIPQDVEQSWDRAEYRVENKWDNAVQDVEDIPQDIGDGVDDAAGWVGRKVGRVERFDDNIESAYDDGYAEGRDDDY